MNGINVNQWTALFKEIGLDDETMHRWHRLFESRHPQGHENFLRWLGVDENRIKEIRNL